MIPAEAVEAVAQNLFQYVMDEPWEAAYPAQEEHFRNRARGLLKAAAPHMLADGWEDAYTLGYADSKAGAAPRRKNPHRTANNKQGEK